MAIEEYCEELDAILAASDEATLSLDEVHGFISAALCGPRELSFRDCLCALLLPEADDDTVERELDSSLVELLTRLYEDTQHSIADGSFLPIVSCEEGDDDELVDARQWCCGFLMAMEYNRSYWKLDNSRVLELLTPIILLAEPKEFERAVKQVGSGDAESFRQELLETLPGSVCALKDLFKKKPRSRRPGTAGSRPAGKRRIIRR